VLSIDGAPVALSSRAFDILLLLIENRDRVVTKDEIFAHVWPGTIVEDNNLAVQISALRRALTEAPADPKLIATVPGRGYRFVGTLEDRAAPAAEEPPAPPPPEPPLIALTPAATAPQPRRRIALLASLGACGLLLAIGAARYAVVRSHVAPRLSIAVLPFRNLSGDPRQDYLADAVSDDLTTDLSHIPGSVVIARESSDVYKGHATPAPDIGSALNVRYLLEGSLTVEAGTFHINAQLIDAPTGTHLWADAFDVTRDKFGAVQAQIVRHIASALDFTLVQVEAARSLSKRPDNQDAVDFFLQARSLLDKGNSKSGLVAAQRLLEKAVAAAPNFSDAQAELGLVLVKKISGSDDPNEWQDHVGAIAAIQKSISLTPQNSISVIANGMLASIDNRCDQATSSFRMALSLDPSSVLARSGLAWCALRLGNTQEAIDQYQEVLRLNPSGAGNAPRLQLIGMAYLMERKPDSALEWLTRAGAGIANSGAPEVPLSWQEWRNIYLIAATELAGDKEGAAQRYAAYDKAQPHRTVWRLAAYDTKALSVLSGCHAYLKALHTAGMPDYATESQDFSVKAPTVEQDGGDFDPTPLNIPGAQRITTETLRSLLAATAKPVILDVGTGSAVIPSAVLVWPRGEWGDQNRMLAEALSGSGAAPDRAVVVMADGPFGWASYNAALHLVALGYRHVLWYRGGEEAWASSGGEAEDRRPM
jgi:TolB-like protein/DNA-binding winged helix-turn-helix (wHTH) protein/rhodanese-related sulfurtransferase